MRRLLFFFFMFMIVYFILSKVWGLFITGKLFQPGEIKKSFQETAHTIWQGMKMFVILWLSYLVIIWVARNLF